MTANGLSEKKNSILEINDLCFAYPEEKKRALNHVSLYVEDGEFLVLCGKSGCGKSTLLTHLKTPLTPHGKRKGEILFQGVSIGEMSNREQSQRIGYVLQNPDNQIVTDKVWHELAFGLESLGYSNADIRIRVAEMASYFGIQDWFYKNVSELSGGQKQLLNLASIMAMHPDMLILDEPTSQLDPIAASDFLETVKKINRDLGTTIILTEHRLEEVFPSADRVVVMDEGQILCVGTPPEIGEELKKRNHEMFLAMPVPMQVYAKVESEQPCPITVRDGRKWLDIVCKKKGISPANASSSYRKESDSQKGKSSFAKITEKFTEKKEDIILACDDLWFRYDKELAGDLSGEGRAGDVILDNDMFEMDTEIWKKQEKRRLSVRTRVSLFILLVAIPLTIAVGFYVMDVAAVGTVFEKIFGPRKYYFISLVIIIYSLLPFFMVFEGRKPQVRELVVLATMVALATAGRAAFFMIPSFKPIIAIVIISAIAFGGEAGFLVGAMTMVVSNFLFGQGPWTPWQMFAMGFIGFLSGILYRIGLLPTKRLSLCIYGFLVTVFIYGGIMNPAALFMSVYDFTWEGLLAIYISGIPVDLVHASSTFIFLWIGAKPLLEKLQRIKIKYDLMR